MDGFAERLRKSGLPLDRIIVIGSGAMDLHGLRMARDIDLVVDADLFESLESSKEWRRGKDGSSSYSLENDDIEIWTDWSTDGTGSPDYGELLKSSEVIDGIRTVTLDFLKMKKRESGRRKDIEDIKEIDKIISDE